MVAAAAAAAAAADVIAATDAAADDVAADAADDADAAAADVDDDAAGDACYYRSDTSMHVIIAMVVSTLMSPLMSTFFVDINGDAGPNWWALLTLSPVAHTSILKIYNKCNTIEILKNNVKNH